MAELRHHGEVTMRRTKADAEKTREAVLDAAEDVFFEKGVSRSTLEQIACRAGVTRGAVYFHFKDKAEVFRALQDRVRLPQEDLLDQAVQDGHDDPLGLVESSAIACLHILAEDVRRQRIITILSHRCEDVGEMSEVLVRMSEAREAMHQKLLGLMEMAKANGTLSADWEPSVAARSIKCSITGLLEDWLRHGKAFSLTEVGSKLISALTHSMRADGRAGKAA
jgi:AcrR family transcriptional regulator